MLVFCSMFVLHIMVNENGKLISIISLNQIWSSERSIQKILSGLCAVDVNFKPSKG